MLNKKKKPFFKKKGNVVDNALAIQYVIFGRLCFICCFSDTVRYKEKQECAQTV